MNKTRSKKGWLDIKIDLSKAFDSLEWNFIEKVLRNIGFHTKFIDWIMQCITTPSFSVLVNGSPLGFFKSSRGLRQDNPLSILLLMTYFQPQMNGMHRN